MIVKQRKTLIIIQKKNESSPSLHITHSNNLSAKERDYIIKVSIEALKQSNNYIDITGYVAQTLNNSDNSDNWHCICGLKESFNITGPEKCGIAFTIGKYKFVIFKQ